MSKLAAALHGIPCNGRCCPPPMGTGPRNPYGTCAHQRVCAYHLTRDAQTAVDDALQAAHEEARLSASIIRARPTRARRGGTR